LPAASSVKECRHHQAQQTHRFTLGQLKEKAQKEQEEKEVVGSAMQEEEEEEETRRPSTPSWAACSPLQEEAVP
jgi:hypothetical protein